MKEQVIMGVNGQLGVAIPLYPSEFERLKAMDGYAISIYQPSKPIACAIDFGAKNLNLINAEFVEANA